MTRKELKASELDLYVRHGRSLQSAAVREGLRDLFVAIGHVPGRSLAYVYERMRQTPASIIR